MKVLRKTALSLIVSASAVMGTVAPAAMPVSAKVTYKKKASAKKADVGYVKKFKKAKSSKGGKAYAYAQKLKKGLSKKKKTGYSKGYSYSKAKSKAKSIYGWASGWGHCFMKK